MKICVLSRNDHRGRCDPFVFYLGSRRHPVVTILTQWVEAPHHYFKVQVEDGRRFVLRLDPDRGEWQLAAAYGGERWPAAVVRI